jgi:D-alanyl-D-alanine carboxypeptidase (penicillin-binding protein 5/6)
VPVLAPQDFLLTLPRSARTGLKATVAITQPVPAPVVKGQTVGTLTVETTGMPPKEYALVAGADVPRAGFFERLWMKFKLVVRKREG